MKVNSSYLARAARFAEAAVHTLLEMNVVNLDTLRADFTALLDQAVQQRGATVAPTVRALIIKRAVKAMGNDEAGTMTTRAAVEQAPDDAPNWLRTALDKGEEVWTLSFKDGFEVALAHVVDWLAADAQADRAVKAAPDADFLGHLGEAADRYFAQAAQAAATDGAAQAKAQRKQDAVKGEPGTEVVMTFRLDPATQQPMASSDVALEADARGPVVMSWRRLDSAEALNREGKLMGHCVGSYANLVADEHVVIYSLRNPENQPHATVELNQRGRTPTINQVKGQGNRPPLGRYAPYVRDFLNTMGVQASWSGADDLQGLGLLTHKGKYGTILDIGGDILATFPNGDSLRYLSTADDEEQPSWRTRRAVTKKYWYVEKDGTVPFRFTLSIAKDLGDFKMLRKENSRFAIYQKLLIKFFTENEYASDSRDTFGQIGIFYDNSKKLWGTKDALSQHLFKAYDLDVSRFVDEVWIFDGTVFVAALSLRRPSDVPYKIKIENDTPASRHLRDVIVAYMTKYGAAFSFGDLTDGQKDFLLQFGIFPRKDGLTGVPEKARIFTGKTGSVRHYQHRLYVFDNHGHLLGTCYTGSQKPEQGLEIELPRISVLGDANLIAVYAILSGMTQADAPPVRVKQTYQRGLIEKGFTVIAGKLLPISQIETQKALRDGYSFAVKAEDQGERTLTLSKDERDCVGVRVDDKNVVRRVWTGDRNADNFRHTVSRTGLVEYSAPLAAMLNAAGVVMRRRQMLDYILAEKNGKFAPVTDPVLIQFMQQGAVDLGHGFMFKINYGYDKTKRDEGRRWEPHTYGYIRYHDDEYHTVVTVKFADGNKQDLMYHMVRDAIRANASFTRDDVIKASARLMKLFHDKVEPYLSNDWVGTAPPPNTRDDD